MLGNTLTLQIIRNAIELVGFAILFLLLDNPKYSWKKTIISYSLFIIMYLVPCTVWSLIDIFSYGKFVTLSIFAGALIFFPLMSKDNPFQAFYNLSLQIFILIFQIVFGIWMSLWFFNGSPWADIFFRLIYLIAVACTYLRWFRKPFRQIALNTSKGWWPISLISMAGNLLVIYYWTRPEYLLLRSAREQAVFACIWALFFVTHLIMIRSLLLMKRETEEKQKNQLAVVNSHLLKRQLEMMEESIEQAKRIRHDTRHHNMQIAEYVKNRQLEELLEYLGEFEQEAESNIVQLICRNIAANNILSAYVHKAKQHGIAVSFDVNVDENIGVNDIDMVAILANIMENAIHSCVRSNRSNPFIDVYIGKKSGKLVIYVRNTVSGDILFENGIPKSKLSEGVGMSSILRSVAKYGGEYDFNADNGIFTCQILLKISHKKEKIQI